MQLPLQVTFRDLPPSPAVEAAIRRKAASLERFAGHITACRVTVEMPARRHRQGALYRVRVDLTLPGEELVAGRSPDLDHAHEDVYVAIRDAFRATRRLLQDYVRRRRAQVKAHGGQEHARVARLLPDGAGGFLETADGREIYFHRNSLLGTDIGRLEVGTEVRFAEEIGNKGPQASTVYAVRGEGHHELTIS